MMPVYSIQSQSTLFRLPRELRDQIYEYYLRAENGYFYDPHTEKMMDRILRLAHELLKSSISA
jgi:hypothetical protein